MLIGCTHVSVFSISFYSNRNRILPEFFVQDLPLEYQSNLLQPQPFLQPLILKCRLNFDSITFRLFVYYSSRYLPNCQWASHTRTHVMYKCRVVRMCSCAHTKYTHGQSVTWSLNVNLLTMHVYLSLSRPISFFWYFILSSASLNLNYKFYLHFGKQFKNQLGIIDKK